jgi:outer membrane lipoprotein-sorting protein
VSRNSVSNANSAAGFVRATALMAMAISAQSACRAADSLDAILTRMDSAARAFKSITANIKQTEYNALLKDSEEALGVMKIKRDNKSVMAITEYSKPDPHTELIRDKTVNIYRPKAKVNEVYDLGKNVAVADQFLLLAFGTSGSDLKKNYDIKFGGAETINSIATSRIELTPKSEEGKKFVTKIELWIPEGQSIAIREKAMTPSDNYYLFDYSNLKPNAPLSDSDFNLKLPAGVRTVHPQH